MYFNNEVSMNKKALIKQMTLEEKASLCSGLGSWWTKPIDRLGIPSIMMSDGPHGLRKQKTKTEQVGIHESYPATCYPPAVNLASSFNLDLVEEVGRYIALEAKAEGISIVLGPGANIKRHPFGGRNFEYFSEDPFLSGMMASAYIKGVQKEGVGTSLKHFVANNQETNRMSIDTIVDQRTLHEIYLSGFKRAIIEAKPWTIMAAYNLINGLYACENKPLLDDVLRKTYGYEGVIVSDWGAINDRVEGLKSTLDLEMPTSKGINDQLIVKAVNEGSLDLKVLDQSVERLLNIIDRGHQIVSNKTNYDPLKHHQFARQVAAETMVLLKNENSILPLNTKNSLAIIGEFAQKPRYQGAGSSQIVPTFLDQFTNILDKEYSDVQYHYAKGYDLNAQTLNPSDLEEAIKIAKQNDIVLLFVGLPDLDEAEGYDRENLNLSEIHERLISELCSVNQKVVVILSNGSPVAMPWLNQVSAVLESYLGGQAKNGAIADILFGKVNPSARLAETFPNAITEFPANQNFPGKPKQVLYKEGLYVGYRYYVSANVNPLFSFGHGLSYTKFEYEHLKVEKKNDQLCFQFSVKNSGQYDGHEVCQLYVSKEISNVYRPKLELKGFKKVWIEKNSTVKVEIILPLDDLKIYDIHVKYFVLESGEYAFYIGSASNQLKLNDQISIEGVDVKKDENEYFNIDQSFEPLDSSFEKLLGGKIPKALKKRPFSRRSTLRDIRSTLIGRIIYNKVMNEAKKSKNHNMTSVEEKMMIETISALPLKTLVSFGGVDNRKVNALIALLNRRFVKAYKLYRNKI
jgi:beta-glucosidase